MTMISSADFEAALAPLNQEISEHLSQTGVPPEVVDWLNKVSIHLQYRFYQSLIDMIQVPLVKYTGWQVHSGSNSYPRWLYMDGPIS